MVDLGADGSGEDRRGLWRGGPSYCGICNRCHRHRPELAAATGTMRQRHRREGDGLDAIVELFALPMTTPVAVLSSNGAL
jgi:hypothetical protein